MLAEAAPLVAPLPERASPPTPLLVLAEAAPPAALLLEPAPPTLLVLPAEPPATLPPPAPPLLLPARFVTLTLLRIPNVVSLEGLKSQACQKGQRSACPLVANGVLSETVPFATLQPGRCPAAVWLEIARDIACPAWRRRRTRDRRRHGSRRLPGSGGPCTRRRRRLRRPRGRRGARRRRRPWRSRGRWRVRGSRVRDAAECLSAARRASPKAGRARRRRLCGAGALSAFEAVFARRRRCCRRRARRRRRRRRRGGRLLSAGPGRSPKAEASLEEAGASARVQACTGGASAAGGRLRPAGPGRSW